MSTTSAGGIWACSTVLPALGIVAVSLRFYTRIKLKVNLEFDDWAQIPALVLFVGMAISALIGVANRAFGYPSPPGPPTFTAPSTILCEKLIFALQILQILDLALIKIAALSFFRRIFCAHRPSKLNSIIWSLIILIAAWAITFITFYASACGSHPNAAWRGNFPFAKYCIITERFEEAYAITDFSLDFFVLIVPIPSIWSLKTSITRKMSITAIFLLALVGFGASIARLVIFVRLAGGASHKSAIDIQLNDTQAVWFSMLETGFALIAVNLPSIWGLVSHSSVNSFLGSLKSLLSIRSRTSSPDSRQYVGLENKWQRRKSSADTSQDIRLVPNSGNAHIDSSAMRDLEGGYKLKGVPKRVAPDNGIDVQRSIVQVETRNNVL